MSEPAGVRVYHEVGLMLARGVATVVVGEHGSVEVDPDRLLPPTDDD